MIVAEILRDKFYIEEVFRKAFSQKVIFKVLKGTFHLKSKEREHPRQKEQCM